MWVQLSQLGAWSQENSESFNTCTTTITPCPRLFNLSMSSMPDKAAFMKELVRVTAPGGRVIVVTWCHRELRPNEEDLASKELRLLDKINDGTLLPIEIEPLSLFSTLLHSPLVCKLCSVLFAEVGPWFPICGPRTHTGARRCTIRRLV